ncbi:MAG: hypothetical protein M1817_005105 [Caeruleum heppii]|nr:MAG: hypothetical protein M1817_005105 [Caeruleum heppii]
MALDFSGDPLTQSVPMVTEADLLAFHATHFTHHSTSAFTSTYLLSSSIPHHSTPAQPPPGARDEEDQDALGYYPDGNKRTLTDEQIAMFRHSEIQRITKQRRLQAERHERGSESPVGDHGETHNQVGDIARKRQKGRKTKKTQRVPQNEEEEYAEYLRKESAELSRTTICPRPWADADHTEAQDLDYGDQPARAGPRELDSAALPVSGRKIVSYGDVDEGNPSSFSPMGSPPPVTQEFVWPRIG